jgi:hypothetical protein
MFFKELQRAIISPVGSEGLPDILYGGRGNASSKVPRQIRSIPLGTIGRDVDANKCLVNLLKPPIV